MKKGVIFTRLTVKKVYSTNSLGLVGPMLRLIDPMLRPQEKYIIGIRRYPI